MNIFALLNMDLSDISVRYHLTSNLSNKSHYNINRTFLLEKNKLFRENISLEANRVSLSNVLIAFTYGVKLVCLEHWSIVLIIGVRYMTHQLTSNTTSYTIIYLSKYRNCSYSKVFAMFHQNI